MKKLIMIIASALCISRVSAQDATSQNCQKLNNTEYCLSTTSGQTVLTKDGTQMPGSIVFNPIAEKAVNKYCVRATVWKNEVMNNGEVVHGNIALKDGATLTEAGIVIWSDKSRSVLKNGTCVDESGTIYGASDISPATAAKTSPAPKPKLDVVVNNYSFYPPR